ncbi:2-oxo acid dehydrogenase subunit E2 [Streptomyces bungoensis]|uniref:2-oxo acid dehydrogenase subunit E2 n=1 Tax=Streptomyces bungoensis TaxID=285568 RepID=UPI000A5C37E9|nr:2-oxo acid dehydrogenase subunit E2 [Streptomyces bungoensis]
MTEFTMPSLGADMDEGVLREWLVAPGDRVRKGDVVAVVETEKAAIEVECFESGTIERLLVPPGTRVPVGAPLAVIGPGGAGVGGAGTPGEPVRAGAVQAPPQQEPPKHRRKARREAEPGRGPVHAESGETPAEHPAPARVAPAHPSPMPPVPAALGEAGPKRARAGGGAATAGREPEPARRPAGEKSRRPPAEHPAPPSPPPAPGGAGPTPAGTQAGAATATAAPGAPRPEPPKAGQEPAPARRPAGEESGETRAEHAAPAPERPHKAAREPEPGPRPAHGEAPAEQPVAAEAPPALGAGPLVRHLAVSRGVDLAALHGTGRGGRVTRADVEHARPPLGPRVRATPYARRLARELGVDLTGVAGSGDGGAVRAADVHAAVRARQDQVERPGPRAPAERPPDGGPRAVTDQRTDAMRRVIAELMSRSKREIPHYYLSTTVDLAAAVDWLRRYNRGRPPADRLVPAALLLKAAAAAAREVPDLNGHWRDGGFVPASGVHLGVAVSLRQGGLLAPVIHDADSLSPDALMGRLRDLVQRARRGRLRGSETTGATLTVTNLGDQGVESVYGVIHPPQVALVGFGAVVERPWAAGGMLGVRPVVTATLAADHRATDGAVGARYLTAVGRLLQRPEEW